MNDRRDLSIGQRLFTGTAAIAILIAILGGTMAVSVSRIRAMQHERIEVLAPGAVAARELERAIYQQAIAFRTYVIVPSPAALEAFELAEADVEQRMRRVEALPGAGDGPGLFAEIVPIAAAHRRSFEELLALKRAGGSVESLRAAEARVTAHRTRLIDKLRTFAALQEAQDARAARAIGQAITDLQRAVIVVTILILVASFVKTYIVRRSVRAPAARLVAAAESLRAGSFGPALALQDERRPDEKPFRDELREAAHVFGRMAAALERRERRLAAHSRLSAVLGTSLDPREVASHALREVTGHVGAEIAIVYLAEDDATLRPIATVAIGDAVLLAIGEGLPGQAAADRTTRVVRDIPSDTPFRVRLGIDDVPPRWIVASPLTVKERVNGVLVMGGLRDLDDDALSFIELAARQLAITLDNALAHERIAGLASELQNSNEMLQSQNEELQAQSEELQAQNEELQAQSEELQNQAEELQSQAHELRAQGEALEQINRELARAEEQKNHFLAVLGHELRNPLAAITGAVALLGEGRGEYARTFQVVRQQSAHLASLLDDLLDVGRITSGKIVLARRPLELGAVATRCVNLLSPSNGGGPTLSVRADEPVWIDADDTRVEQIITNLLTNALKFTSPNGSVSVSVSREGAEAVIRVSDDGIGIDRDLLPRVFDFFVQGPARPGQKGGLGIGLTLVKTLTELHGGTVEAMSEGAGKGTTFTVRFPVIAAPEEVVTTPAPPRLTIKRSVVVVEDNADIRQMMQLWLRQAGHTVAEAHDGPSGVQMVMETKPDFALIDLDLPGFDGCEVARRLRQDPRASAVRLIAVSGYGRPEDRARALEAGFDDHFVKPLDLERLAAVLRVDGAA